MGAVHLEYVPEDWLAADLHHRLGFEVCFLTDAGAKAPARITAFIVRVQWCENDQELRGARSRTSRWKTPLPINNSP